MNYAQQKRFNFLYEQHLTNLRLQDKRPATITHSADIDITVQLDSTFTIAHQQQSQTGMSLLPA